MWGCRGVGMGQRHRVRALPLAGGCGGSPRARHLGSRTPGGKVTEILLQLPVIDQAAGWGDSACAARQRHAEQRGTAWHSTGRSAGCHWSAWASITSRQGHSCSALTARRESPWVQIMGMNLQSKTKQSESTTP